MMTAISRPYLITQLYEIAVEQKMAYTYRTLYVRLLIEEHESLTLSRLIFPTIEWLTSLR